MKLTLAAAFALLAAPAFAADMTTMTCADMMALDSAGMATAGTDLKTAMPGDAKIGAMADADLTTMASEACTANPDGTVLDAVHASMINSMTCADLMAMDATGMAEIGTRMKTAMTDNTEITAMADADVASKAQEACTAHPDGTVVDALKM